MNAHRLLLAYEPNQADPARVDQAVREGRFETWCDELRHHFQTVDFTVGTLAEAAPADAYLWFARKPDLQKLQPDRRLLARSAHALVVALFNSLCDLSEAFETLGGVDDSAFGDWRTDLDETLTPEERAFGGPPTTLVAAPKSLVTIRGYPRTRLNASVHYPLVWMPGNFVQAISTYLPLALDRKPTGA